MEQTELCVLPYDCGEKDCSQHWHQNYYFLHQDQSFTYCDQDGNHEYCDEDDIPSNEDVTQAWQDYYAYVAETGKDPLKEFLIPTAQDKKHVWQAKIRNWIGAAKHGLMVVGIRRRARGKWMTPDTAPQVVKQYLLLNDKKCIEGIKSFEQLTEETDAKLFKKFEMRITFEVDEPTKQWNEKRLATYLKRAAKRSLTPKNEV